MRWANIMAAWVSTYCVQLMSPLLQVVTLDGTHPLDALYNQLYSSSCCACVAVL